MTPSTISRPFVEVEQGDNSFWLTSLSAKDLVNISYVAHRGATRETGAVQRLLNPKRISSIRDFAIKVGDFPSCIILNWVNSKHYPKRSSRNLIIPRSKLSAQIIDGQHRVAGLEAAIAEDSSVSRLMIPVAIYHGLDTRQCANIFLSINTEQKPVPRSLVFDLYEVASDFIIDAAAVRARDLAVALNENEESPYFEYIKFPGAKPNERGIALSTVVSTLKPLVDDKGDFEQAGVPELQMQEQILFNFLWVLQDCYGDEWWDKKNVFLYAAGFTGAIDFFRNKILRYCNLNADFSLDRISGAFSLTPSQLLYQPDVKGMQGRKAFSYVSEHLASGFHPESKSRKIKL